MPYWSSKELHVRNLKIKFYIDFCFGVLLLRYWRSLTQVLAAQFSCLNLVTLDERRTRVRRLLETSSEGHQAVMNHFVNLHQLYINMSLLWKYLIRVNRMMSQERSNPTQSQYFTFKSRNLRMQRTFQKSNKLIFPSVHPSIHPPI